MKKGLLKSIFFPAMIVLVVAFLAWVNYTPGSFLSGWDNTHPEFNLAQYSKRVIFGAWQEHMGTGAPAAQGFASEITRLPILYGLSWLPLNLQRYSYVFLMYLTGGLGIFYYLKNFWLQKNTRLREWLAFLGAIFYLTNTLTLQQFYIIFEMFAVQFAFFPFVLMSIHKLYEKFNIKNTFIFFLTQLLIAPSAHTPTVFYLGALLSMVYAGFLSLGNKGWWKSFGFASKILGLTLLIHSFWMVPNIYFSLNHSNYLSESKANQLFNPESLWSVRSAGSWQNLLTGTHYLFSWKDFDFKTSEYELIFEEWLGYFSDPTISVLLMGLGGLVVVGFITTLLDARRSSNRWALVLFYIGAVALIWIDLLPTKGMVDWLYSHQIFYEAFRNPFTKLTILLSFVWSVFMVSAIDELIRITRKISWLGDMLVVVVLGVMILVSWPAFSGQFINEKLKIVYPKEYFELFAYMETRDESERVLELPYYSHEGWVFYDWGDSGYEGAGFMHYGIPQALLTPDFGRWGESTDGFYAQLRYALDRKSSKLMLQLLKKYHVNMVLLDESMINPYGGSENIEMYKELLGEVGASIVWQKENIFAYELSDIQFGEVIEIDHISQLSGETKRLFFDPLFGSYFHFISTNQSKVFPFSNLLNEKIDADEINSQNTVFRREVSDGRYKVVMPGRLVDWRSEFENESIHLYPSEGKVSNPLVFDFEGDEISIVIHDSWNELSLDGELQNCSNPQRGEVKTISKEDEVLYQADGGAVNCSGLILSDFSTNTSLLLRVVGVNEKGRSIKLFVNEESGNKFADQYLLPEGSFDEIYVLPQFSLYPSNYILNWETRSFGQLSQNSLQSLNILPVPIEFLSQIRLIPEESGLIDNKINIETINSFDVGFLRLGVSCEVKSCVLVHDQAFDDGWMAIDLLDKKILTHIIVSGWSNGWIVPEGNQEVLIIYIYDLVVVCLSVVSSIFVGLLIKTQMSERKKNI